LTPICRYDTTHVNKQSDSFAKSDAQTHHVERERERDRQTDRQTETERERAEGKVPWSRDLAHTQ